MRKLTASSSSVEVYVDGALKLTATAGAALVTCAKIGFIGGVTGSPSTDSGIKNVYVYDLSGGELVDRGVLSEAFNRFINWTKGIFEAIEEQGDGYIRYTSGIQICWGTFSGISTSSKAIAFQKPFVAWKDVTVTLAGSNNQLVTEIAGWGITEFFVRSTGVSNNPFMWQAIGRWKQQ